MHGDDRDQFSNENNSDENERDFKRGRRNAATPLLLLPLPLSLRNFGRPIRALTRVILSRPGYLREGGRVKNSAANTRLNFSIGQRFTRQKKKFSRSRAMAILYGYVTCRLKGVAV